MQTKYDLNQRVYYKSRRRNRVVEQCHKCQGKGGFIVDGSIRFCSCNKGSIETYIDTFHTIEFTIKYIGISRHGVFYGEYEDDNSTMIEEKDLHECVEEVDEGEEDDE